jgi:hypothetical protein
MLRERAVRVVRCCAARAIGAVPLPSSQSTLLGLIGPPWHPPPANRSGGGPLFGWYAPAALSVPMVRTGVRARSIPDLAKLDGSVRVVDDEVESD